MIHVILTLPDGSEARLDTPDARMIGDWLKSIADTFGSLPPRAPVQMQIRIS